MFYTADVIDGKVKISLPAPWKNKKRVRVKKEFSRVVIDFEKELGGLKKLKKLITNGLKSGAPQKLESY